MQSTRATNAPVSTDPPLHRRPREPGAVDDQEEFAFEPALRGAIEPSALKDLFHRRDAVAPTATESFEVPPEPRVACLAVADHHVHRSSELFGADRGHESGELEDRAGNAGRGDAVDRDEILRAEVGAAMHDREW